MGETGINFRNLPLASIIIPNYNGEKFIEECLNSVYSLDYPSFEAILVDDGSEDNSARIAESSFPKARIIKNKENLGFSKTINKGIKASSGEVIALLNIDTIVRKNWLSELVKSLLSDPKIGIVGSKMLDLDGKTIQFAGAVIDGIGISRHIGRGEIDIGQFDSVREVDYICGASMAFRKSLMEEIGLLDEGYSPIYYEDSDFVVRAKRKGYKIVYVPTSVLLHYENHSMGKLSRHFYFYYNKSRIRFIIKKFTLRHILSVFLKQEIKWFKGVRSPDEKRELLRAYLANTWCFISTRFNNFLKPAKNNF